MRHFEVYSQFINKDGSKIVDNTNTNCFAGINTYLKRPDKVVKETPYLAIERFREPETEKYIPLIVKVINQITECELTTLNNKEIIKFKLLRPYDKSLVLLNFIRNLWSIQAHIFPVEYNIAFFEYLKKSRYKDPFKRLTSANIKALIDHYPADRGPAGHSNCHPPGLLKINGMDHLSKNYSSTQKYLT